MKNLLKVILATFMAIFLSGCEKVETGQVGVRIGFNGGISKEELQQGFHMAILDTIKVFSVKQIPLQLENLQPKANDNLTLEDLDVTVFYSVNPEAISDIYIKYQNATIKNEGEDIYSPAYKLINNLAKSVTNDIVSKYNSMEVNSKRNEIEKQILEMLQKDLNEKDEGAFTVERVTISNIKVDSSVTKSIQEIANSENKKRIAQNELIIAKTEAERNEVISKSLNKDVLALKQMEVMKDLVNSNNKIIVVPMDFKGMVNVPAN